MPATILRREKSRSYNNSGCECLCAGKRVRSLLFMLNATKHYDIFYRVRAILKTISQS